VALEVCVVTDEYRGGHWHFYELSNGGFYMAAACLFAFSHLSFQIQNDVISRHYYELRDFALEHAEATAIFGAID
jgi:hypothetical protein